MAKIQRCQNTFLLDVSSKGVNNAGYVDIAQCLSVLNRRKYEQGRLYHIQSLQLFAATPNGSGVTVDSMSQVSYSGAPNTWVTANAWFKAKKTWQAMRAEVLKKNPSLEGKWDDFKVSLNYDHFSDGWANNLLPSLASTSNTTWDASSMVLPDWDVADTAGNVFHLGLLDDDQGSVPGRDLTYGGIIYNYQETRARVDTDQPDSGDPADAWGIRVLDMGGQESQLTDHIIDESDDPPYDQVNYPGVSDNAPLAIHGYDTISKYNLDSTTPGFYLPCGLLRTFQSNVSDNDLSPALLITVTPGTYQGVHAPTMRQ